MSAVVVDGRAARVERLVASVAAQQSISWPVGPLQSLVDVGFTSMSMVELMLAIEREFDLVIPDHDLIPGNFDHLNALVAMVRRLTDGKPQRPTRQHEPAEINAGSKQI